MNKSLKDLLIESMQKGIQLLFPLISFSIVSRVLGQNFFGQISITQNYILYFQTIAIFGLNIFGVKTCSNLLSDRIKLNNRVNELITFSIVLSVLLFILLLVFFTLNPNINKFNLQLIVISSLYMLFSSLNLNWYFYSTQMYNFIFFSSLISRLLSLIFLVKFVNSPSDNAQYLFSIFLGEFVSFIISFYFINNQNRFKWKFNNFFNDLNEMFPYFLSSFYIIIYTQVDSTLIGIIGTTRQLSVYTVGFKVTRFIMSFLSSIPTVMLPKMSKLSYTKLSSDFSENIILVVYYSLQISIFASIIVNLFASDIIMILSSDKYLESINVMKFSAFLIPITLTSSIFIYLVLIPFNKSLEVSKLLLSVSVLSIVVNYYLINSFSINGAVFSQIFVELTILIVSVFLVLKFQFVYFSRKFLFRLFYFLVLYIVIILFGFIYPNLILKLTLIIIYLFIVLLNLKRDKKNIIQFDKMFE